MSYIDIQDAVVKVLKEIDPLVDVFNEEIKKTEEEGISLSEYYFLTLLPTGTVTVSSEITDRSVFIDIAYYNNAESNALYLEKMEELDKHFRPVFRFLDRAITIKNVEMKVVDYVLHYSFTLHFREEIKKDSLPTMGELQIGV